MNTDRTPHSAGLPGFTLWEWNITDDKIDLGSAVRNFLGIPEDSKLLTFQEWMGFLHPDDRILFKKKLNNHFEDHAETLFSCTIRYKFKSESYLQTVCTGRVTARNGKMSERMIGCHDFTVIPENITLKAKRDSTLLQLLMEHLPHSIFFKDRESKFIKINRTCAIKFGLKDPKEALGKSDFDFFGKEHAESALQDEQHILKTGESIIDKEEKELPIGNKGKVRWALTTKLPLYDQEQNIVGTFGITRDITDQKEAERALKKSEKKYRDIFENIQDVIYRTDKDGAVTDISPSIEKYSGYKREEIIGSLVPKFYYHPEDREKLFEALKKKGSVSDFEIRLKTADDKLIHTSVNAYLQLDENDEATGVEGIMRDITDRKLAEIELKETYTFFNQILSTTSEGIYVCDLDLKYIYWNRQMEKISGLKQEEIMGKTPVDIFSHIKENHLFENYQKALRGERVKSGDYHFEVKKTGMSGWAQAQYIPMRNNEAEIVGVLVTIVDISDRKRAEEQLRESDETLKKLSEQVPGAIFQFQQFPDGRNCFPYSSDGIKKVYGLTPEEVRYDAVPVLERIHKEDLESVIDSISYSYHTGENWEKDYRVNLPGQGVRWVRGNSRPEKQADGSVIWHGYLTDITERKQKENQLNETIDIVSVQNARLLNFAHIVSHNLRNHAGNISMLIELIETEETEEEKKLLSGYLKTASERLNESIKDLNEIVDAQEGADKQLRRLHFSEHISKVKEILTTKIISNSVRFDVSVPEDFTILYNPAYLESILLNLISNAIKYRDPDRKLLIRIKVEIVNNDPVLTISDNGLGIDLKKYGHKLFGMYNTFHGNRNSKGVGLFITKNQVESMGGSVEVESEVGKGTTFRVRLSTNLSS